MPLILVIKDFITNLLPDKLRYCIFDTQRILELPQVMKLFKYKKKATTIFVEVK